MTTTADQPGETGWYEIRLAGHLAARRAASFDGMALTRELDGTTAIRGLVIDQAALHGLLHRIRDLGLPLVSVVRTEPDSTLARSTNPIDPTISTPGD